MKTYKWTDNEGEEYELTKKQIRSIKTEERHQKIREGKKTLASALGVSDLNDISRIKSPEEYRRIEREFNKMKPDDPLRSIVGFQLERGIRKTNRKKPRKKK